MQFLGGTLFQLIMPAAFVAYFACSERADELETELGAARAREISGIEPHAVE